MKQIRKNDFKRLSDLIYILNHIPCKECKKTIKVSDTIYHGLVISNYLK